MIIIVNLIGLVMLVTIVVMISITNQYMLCLLLALFWLVFEIVGNYWLLRGRVKVQSQLYDSDRRGIFSKQIKIIQSQYDSVLSRQEFFKEQDDNLQKLYNEILEQMESNIKSASAFMESYDYITRPEPKYLISLCSEGDILINKFNALIEQIVDIDTNSTNIDTSYIDDVISCMNEIKKL